jgi:ADP-heptose:LPS heptosyltransferase
MNYENIKFDCKHFKGTIPCQPNKENGSVCEGCTSYSKIEQRILIIKLGALGDVIRTTPLVVKLKEIYPKAHITWLTLSPSILPKEEIDCIYQLDAISLFNIQHQSFDIAINLDKDEEACKLLTLVHAKTKHGFTWQNNQIGVATEKAKHKLITGLFDSLSKENTKNYLEEIFEICDLKFNFEPYLINLNKDLASKWKSHFQDLTDKKIIGLNTGCGPRWNTRLWPLDYWKELALLLIEEGYFPVFLGGELEHEKNEDLSRATGAYYPGYFSLEEFIALTNSMDLVVTQVSMMMHIATALQKQMVLMNTIFNKHEFELYNRGEIVGPPLECICYYGNSCKRGQSCMHDIYPQTIFKAIERNM